MRSRQRQMALIGLVLASGALAACAESPYSARQPPVSTEPGQMPPAPEASRDVMAVGVGNQLRLFSIDGGDRTVLADSPVFADVQTLTLDGVADTVLVRGDVPAVSDPVRIAVVTADGEIRLQQSHPPIKSPDYPSVQGTGLLLGQDGVISIYDRNTISTLSPEGTAQLSGVTPYGRSTGGYLPVYFQQDVQMPFIQRYGWWHIGSGAEIVAEQRFDIQGLIGQPRALFFGGQFVYVLVGVDGATKMRFSSLTETTDVPLPGATARAMLMFQDSGRFPANERWFLVNGGSADLVFRVDVQDRTVQKMTLRYPAGYRLLGYCGDQGVGETLSYGNGGIDADGNIYAVLRTDDQAAVMTTSDGEHWSRVGGAMTGVGAVSVMVHGGTYEIRAMKGAYCYGPGNIWTSPSSAEFSGDSLQLVRRQTQARVLVAVADREAPWTAFSRTGRYAARWSKDATSGADVLERLDIETGVKTSLLTGTANSATQPIWLAAP